MVWFGKSKTVVISVTRDNHNIKVTNSAFHPSPLMKGGVQQVTVWFVSVRFGVEMWLCLSKSIIKSYLGVRKRTSPQGKVQLVMSELGAERYDMGFKSHFIYWFR